MNTERNRMRVAILFFPIKQSEKIQKISKSLAQGIETQGHQVDIINGSKDVNTRLSIYQYVILGAEVPELFNTKPPESIGHYLKNAGMVAGKRSFAFILPKLLGAEKSLRRLMSIMEGEGMFIKFSKILGDEQLATEIGKKLTIVI